MKNLIASLLIFATTSPSFAKDSFWAICIGDAVIYGESAKLVVNVFEHRTESGRATNLTLIYGGHVLQGNFDSSKKDLGPVSLKEGTTSFNGMAAVNYTTNKINFQGVLDLQEKTSLNVTLSCKILGK